MLKPYAVYRRTAPERGVLLVFAESTQQAIALGRPLVMSLAGAQFKGVHARLLRGWPAGRGSDWCLYLLGEPHVAEPETCWRCGKWSCFAEPLLDENCSQEP